MATIALTDDHVLLRNGLAALVKNLGHTVLFEADNGKQLVEYMTNSTAPEIVLMDINMPEMDGFETTQWLKKHHPGVKVMALSMYDNESTIIKMLRSGARGYILKDSDPKELKTALEHLLSKGFYNSDLVTGKLMHAINNMDESGSEANKFILLTDKESEFLKWVCTELTYKEIADQMNLSPRTVDNYRDVLFERLNVKTRVGLVMYACKNGIVRW